jgi:ABC-type glycerol-3-phosphate transport system substrate-binding protein
METVAERSSQRAGRQRARVPGPPRRSILVAALAAPLAAACGATGGGEAPQTAPGSERGRIVHWYTSQFPFDSDLGAQLVQEFKAKYPNVEYVPEVIVGDRFQKLLTAAAASAAPDIGMAGSWQIQEFGATGIALPVDGYLKASRVVKQADLWPTHVYDMTYKGKQYGMPFGPDVRVLYAGTSVLQAAGLSSSQPAQSWEEMEEHIRRLYKEDGGKPTTMGWGPFWGTGNQLLWMIPFWQLGGETLNKDGDKITIDTQPAIQALEWLKKLHDIQGGYDATDEFRRAVNNPVGTAFVTGRTGYTFEAFSSRKETVFSSVKDLQFGFAPWPQPRGGKRANYGGCHAFCVTTQSKAPDAAWRFLEFLADEQNNLRFAIRYDRIPIRVKTAQSPAFHQNDPFLKLSVDEMNYRKMNIPAPGGTEIQSMHIAMVNDAMSGKRSIRDALADTAKQMQQVLDKWRR